MEETISFFPSGKKLIVQKFLLETFNIFCWGLFLLNKDNRMLMNKVNLFLQISAINYVWYVLSLSKNNQGYQVATNVPKQTIEHEKILQEAKNLTLKQKMFIFDLFP